ncbi:hypothetical protein AZI86_11250 [Bdellovibrio bacteriovorus]|uniref:Uncharacterized protein n=1 Tax=Bdellovibrio bacteriovorus TaxID=959 RepID=A0A150WM44_BDEBC|nr:hypothetical protein [Bdellovibrio bacteriovorus]KYG64773.1 hypothetical protein AZI86_11250 [Bdellovibrio bacteriovorus]
MDKIPSQTVQNSIDQICGITEEADLELASQHFFDVQPDLGGFFMEFIEDMSEEAQDLGFMMALILNKAFEDQYKKIRPMNEDEVVARFEANEAEFESFLKINDDMIADLQDKARAEGQPEVFNYIVEELFMSPELEPALGANEQIHLFIICKFLIDCLNEMAKEGAPELVRH